MKIYTSANSTINDFKESFTSEFPFLKLEFYTSENIPLAEKNQPKWLSANKNLHTLLPPEYLNEFEINSSQSIAEMEQLISNKLNLNVQIFCLMRNSWVKIIAHSKITLGAQNLMGQHSYEDIYDEEVTL